MAHDLFKFIADLAKSENSSPLLNSLLNIFRNTVKVGVLLETPLEGGSSVS